MSIIRMENVFKNYRLGNIEVPALKNFDLEIAQGDFISIAGPSGSGKSTILNLIGILDQPTSGKILFQGQDLSLLNIRQRAQLRLAKVGFIFQSFNLLPVLKVYENVEYPLLLLKLTTKERDKRIQEALEAVGLLDRWKHKPNELSGGQRQRVAIARALVTRPQLVLADEPTANLDSKTGEEILMLMQELNKNKQVTFVFASHDPEIIRRAKQVVNIHDGELVSIKTGPILEKNNCPELNKTSVCGQEHFLKHSCRTLLLD